MLSDNLIDEVITNKRIRQLQSTINEKFMIFDKISLLVEFYKRRFSNDSESDDRFSKIAKINKTFVFDEFFFEIFKRFEDVLSSLVLDSTIFMKSQLQRIQKRLSSEMFSSTKKTIKKIDFEVAFSSFVNILRVFEQMSELMKRLYDTSNEMRAR